VKGSSFLGGLAGMGVACFLIVGVTLLFALDEFTAFILGYALGVLGFVIGRAVAA
jgi:hypothetical protein